MNMFYREKLPSTEFSGIILSFWEFAVDHEAAVPLQHEIFPDGCVSLFYHRNQKFNLKRLGLNGLNLETMSVPVFPTDIFWGMRLSPAACADLLCTDPIIFKTKKVLPAERFPHLTTGLLEKLNEAQTFDDAITIYQNRLKEIDFRRSVGDEKVFQAVNLIEETGGEIKIAEIAERLKLSPRQLERRFKKSSGLSPKQFARTRRIRATVVDLVENEQLNWANRAAELGFTDQSHLTREFVSVTKRSPNSFAKKVSQIKHGNLVK
jgi:AraC-like DNA-binding protein